MTLITDMHSVLQPESSGWLFKSPLAGGGGILAAQLVLLCFVIIVLIGLMVVLIVCSNYSDAWFVVDVNAVVQLVGKLASYWSVPLYSMSAMQKDLRDPFNYGTLVRVSTPSDRFATALLMFAQHNDVRTVFLLTINLFSLPKED